jgi:hypothetical protein
VPKTPDRPPDDEPPTTPRIASSRYGRESEKTGPTLTPGTPPGTRDDVDPDEEDTDDYADSDSGSDSADSYLISDRLGPKALTRLAMNLKELNLGQRRSLAIVEDALIAQARRDNARALFLETARESLSYIVRSPWSATIITCGVVLVMLQVSGVEVNFTDVLDTVESIAGQCPPSPTEPSSP